MKKENKALARQKKAQAKQMLALKKKVLTVVGILRHYWCCNAMFCKIIY